jgi:hypothetical protein
MSNLGWLDVDNIDFNALLLLEPLHVQYIASREPDKAMGTALNANPAVVWYLRQTHPPIDDYVQKCLALAEEDPTQAEIHQAEITVLEGMQDWLFYVLNPAQYDQLEFLDWDDQSLLEITKFENKS